MTMAELGIALGTPVTTHLRPVHFLPRDIPHYNGRAAAPESLGRVNTRVAGWKSHSDGDMPGARLDCVSAGSDRF